jgi:poly(A) polymerase
LVDVSGERIRDELAQILLLPFAIRSLKSLQDLGLLFLILPELGPLQGLAQTAPHHLDVFEHTLETVRALEIILAALDPESDHSQGIGIPFLDGLERYAGRIRSHLSEPLTDGRSRVVTLKLAALLHDVGKPSTLETDDEGRNRFIGHEKVSAQIAALALRRLRFSGAEMRVVETVVRNHMRPLLLAEQTEVTRRAVYRFFRTTGDTGVDVILHALADHRATYAPGTGDRQWCRLLSVAVRMLSDFWEHQSERVNPPMLVNGHDLMSEFDLPAGPEIGDLLEAVQEAQADDQVRTREEAMALVRSLLGASHGNNRR